MGFRIEIPGVGEVKGDTPDQTIKNVGSSVSNTFNREISNFGNSTNRTFDDATKGDVGKYTKGIVDAGINLVQAPFQMAYYGVRGDNQGLSRTVQRAVGSSINLQGAESGNIYNSTTIGVRYAQTEEGQSLLRSQPANDLSLGLSGDYAGYFRGARTMQDNAYLSREDQNSALRLGAKGAVIATGAAYGAEITAKAKSGAQYLWGKVIENPGTSLIVGKYLTEGKSSQALQYLAGKGAFDDLKEYLPDLPTIPSEYSDFLNSLIPKSKVPSYLSGSTGTQVNDPWSWSGIADSGLSSTNSNKIYYYIFGATLLAFLAYKGLKK